MESLLEQNVCLYYFSLLFNHAKLSIIDRATFITNIRLASKSINLVKGSYSDKTSVQLVHNLLKNYITNSVKQLSKDFSICG